MEENKPTEKEFTIENNVLIGKKMRYSSEYGSSGDLLYDTLKKDPSFIGQVDVITGEEDTYANMLDRSVKCALWLKKEGVGKGDIVAISTHNHLDSFIPCIAAVFIGAIINPWDDGVNTNLAGYFMRLTEPKVIFANEKSVRVILDAAKIEDLEAKVVTFGEYPGTVSFSDVLQGHSKPEVANFRCQEIEDLSDTAFILCSSGTTGLPKGVELTHRTLLNALNQSPQLRMSDKIPLWFSSLYWISGLFLSFLAITSRVTKIIPPEFQPQKVCEILEKYKVSWLMLSTSMANRFVRYKGLSNYDLSNLKFLMIGGATLKQESHDALQKHLPDTSVLQLYGMTETSGLVAVQLPGGTSGSCGTINSGCEIKIIDIQTGETLGPNKQGELMTKPANPMKGYYKNPTATMEIMREDGWMHTGDLAYYNEEGELFIVDRIKDIIKYRGHQIVPTAIENLLQTHPAVFEVGVVSIPHPTDDEHPVAFVSKRPDKEVTAEELMLIVENKFPDPYKLRGGVHFIPTLPHTFTGKISRIDLKAMAKSMAIP
ncbi:luciferin 4-monooxygenase-like [Halictus rubicundus]|uniref:luciferin 4-monooxygenase-like n=1 Tax=Halictus rubicundus TaxID=77578 RepID=UPI0040367F9D